MSTLVIDPRHCGPARSGNGGWTAGSVAGRLDAAAVEVTLRMPPPLDTPLRWSTTDDTVTLLHDEDVVATAIASTDPLAPVEPVTWAEAVTASQTFPGHTFHPFPTCFVCGTANPDGLRIFPGQVGSVEGHTRVAAPWLVPADVDLATTWAALDCAGGWAGDLTERLMVLGRMSATVDSLPHPGEECVVMGQDHGTEGRRTFSATTVYGTDGRVIGRAAHIWVAVDPARFN